MTVTKKPTKKLSLNGTKKTVKKVPKHPLELMQELTQKISSRGVKFKTFKRA